MEAGVRPGILSVLAVPSSPGSLVFSGVEKHCIVNWLCQPVPATTF